VFSPSLHEYTDRLNFSLNQVSKTSIEKAIAIVRETSDSNHKIWIAGNGGSASTASHFATDLSRCKNSFSNPIKAISLCDNVSFITATGNDFGFDLIFKHQLSNLAKKGDLLFLLTASGNSRNLVLAIEWAKSNSVKTLSITGFDGGSVNVLSDYSIHVPTANGDYGIAEDAQSILCHFLSSQFR
jgi:D-sedoheptulose 7-phosphate isomerase